MCVFLSNIHKYMVYNDQIRVVDFLPLNNFPNVLNNI